VIEGRDRLLQKSRVLRRGMAHRVRPPEIRYWHSGEAKLVGTETESKGLFFDGSLCEAGLNPAGTLFQTASWVHPLRPPRRLLSPPPLASFIQMRYMTSP